MTSEMPSVEFGGAPAPASGLPSGGPSPTTDTGPAVESPLADPRALQILTTEHWSLLSSRSLSYNEAFSRAGMFLTFLSATLIVVGFLISSGTFSEAALPIIALLLAVDLFIGLATIGRLVDAGSEEFTAIRGMNRIRHAYSDMVPGIDRYFVSPIHDDATGVLSMFGTAGDDSVLLGIAHGLTTTIGMLMVVNCVLVAALVGVIATGAGLSTVSAIGLGVVAFVAMFGVFAYAGMKVSMRVAAGPPAETTGCAYRSRRRTCSRIGVPTRSNVSRSRFTRYRS